MSSSAASDDAEARVTTLPVICGPTASGKSAVAMWLAARRGIEIVSADSRQVYRGFDIGTAKPSRADRERVPHHGIDVAEPAARYSAADWAAMARDAVAATVAKGRIPLVVGGTGFYIASLFKPLWAQPPLDRARRDAVLAALAALDTAELRRWCEALDPARARLGRTQLLRAVEVALLTGDRISAMHRVDARPPAYRARYLVIDPGPVLQARIAARAAAMLDGGWPDEVRRLVQRVPADAPAWKATGYEAVRSFVTGTAGRDATLERVVVATRQYAKRQRTWFRHQLDADRVRRVSPIDAGWEAQVEGWFHEVEDTMASERAT